MREGVLVNQVDSDRLCICYGVDDYGYGLHCGEGLDVLIDGEWVPSRIEFAHSGRRWYLVGVNAKGLTGLRVRQ